MRKGFGIVLSAALLAVAVVGCTSQSTPEAQRQLEQAQQQVYAMPAKDLHELAKRTVTSPPLSLSIEQDQNGVIQTGWKEGYEGDLHIARHWQERTRFRIAVIPDWTDPTHKSRLEVSEETQTRSNPRAPYQAQEGLRRPARANEVLRLIQQQILATIAPAAKS